MFPEPQHLDPQPCSKFAASPGKALWTQVPLVLMREGCSQRLCGLRFWGSVSSLPGAWPRRGASIHICTPDFTGLPGADQERVVEGCDEKVNGGREEEGGLGLGGPLACVSRHSSLIASWGCAGELPRDGCPSFPCRTRPCPPLPSPAHPCWTRARHFGEKGAFQVCRQAASLSPPFTVPSTRGQHLWAEMWEERGLVLDPCSQTQSVHVRSIPHQEVPPQEVRGAIVTHLASTDGSPEGG